MGATARDTNDASEAIRCLTLRPVSLPFSHLPFKSNGSSSFDLVSMMRVFLFSNGDYCALSRFAQDMVYTKVFIIHTHTQIHMQNKCMYVYRYVQLVFKPLAWLLRSYFVFWLFFGLACAAILCLSVPLFVPFSLPLSLCACVRSKA